MNYWVRISHGTTTAVMKLYHKSALHEVTQKSTAIARNKPVRSHRVKYFNIKIVRNLYRKIYDHSYKTTGSSYTNSDNLAQAPLLYTSSPEDRGIREFL